MIDTEHVNITISGYNNTLVAPGDTTTSKYSVSNWWTVEWNLISGWKVKLISEYWKPTTFKTSNSNATEGSWECRYDMSHADPGAWKKAHIFENENGYLIHKIAPKNNCKRNDGYQTCIFSCRKTNGESVFFIPQNILLFFLQKITRVVKLRVALR